MLPPGCAGARLRAPSMSLRAALAVLAFAPARLRSSRDINGDRHPRE